MKRFHKRSVALVLFLGGLFLWSAFDTPSLIQSQPDDPVLNVPPGFKAELLYRPSEAEQGSWVSLTTDGKGRLIASDQYGSLYRITPPAIGADPGQTRVEKLNVEIGHANGLLWAFNSLYVVVNANEGIAGRNSGLYRLRDTNNDDQFDSIQLMHAFVGAGEHGPHGIILGPDGQSLYMVAGNHTDLPEAFKENSLVPPVWNEDNLLPPLKDARGHAIDRTAPGGWIVRTDETGSKWEVFAIGFRNTYDIAFNEAGDLFAFDSDMEWDLGSPWYRPIRVLHVTSGAEFGWRTGSGKWPAYYPDTLPSVVDIGQGSPTGVLMGTGAKFPARYQRGLFIFDWSFGTIYMIDLQTKGSTYTGTAEEFLSGIPLPVTDGVIGNDGAFYFATGGRRIDSYLYRVYYVGNESTDPVATSYQSVDGRTLRRFFEGMHGTQHPNAVESVWPHLNHEDRHIRHAARVTLEHQPVERWKEKALGEFNAARRITALIALARNGDASMQAEAVAALNEIDFSALPEDEKINLLRAYGLVFIRLGEPTDEQRAEVAALLGPNYPAGSDALNRELSIMLSYLDAPDVVEKTLPLLSEATLLNASDIPYLSSEISARNERYGSTIEEMLENIPALQATAYVYNLSHVKSGWTLDQRKTYFQWFYDAMQRDGGASYKGFLEHIRANALANVPLEEQQALAELTGQITAPTSMAELPQPQGPGRVWNRREVLNLLGDHEEETRNFEQGERMYRAALCASCHVMRGSGSIIGPDLTQIGTRFSTGDLVTSMTSPSEAISDQYGATLITLNDGSSVMGRIVGETDTDIQVSPNPFAPDQLMTVAKADIQKQEPSPVSPMPPGLLNRLNETEVLDLMAYLLSGGDPDHEVYD